jgi:hypothetical protein
MMALIADDARDRAEQLLLLTDRLTALAEEETRRIEAREPPMDGAEADEKNRLSNAYRLELARIKQDPALISAAPPDLLAKLKTQTIALHAVLDRHEIVLGAVKLVAEGLVQAMAAEVARQRGGARGYSAHGAMAAASGPSPAVLDRTA